MWADGRRPAVVQSAREQLGESDAPVEDEVVEAFDRIVDEGAQRLHRSWREVLTTGLAGGLATAVLRWSRPPSILQTEKVLFE